MIIYIFWLEYISISQSSNRFNQTNWYLCLKFHHIRLHLNGAKPYQTPMKCLESYGLL